MMTEEANSKQSLCNQGLSEWARGQVITPNNPISPLSEEFFNYSALCEVNRHANNRWNIIPVMVQDNVHMYAGYVNVLIKPVFICFWTLLFSLLRKWYYVQGWLKAIRLNKW